MPGREYDKPDARLFLFLDEIQKMKDWAAQVKLLYDSLPKAKFVVSGSATLPLEKRSKIDPRWKNVSR